MLRLVTALRDVTEAHTMWPDCTSLSDGCSTSQVKLRTMQCIDTLHVLSSAIHIGGLTLHKTVTYQWRDAAEANSQLQAACTSYLEL